MIVISDEEYLHDVKGRAEGNGCLAALEKELAYLAGYACPADDPTKVVVVLYRDFAPESFGVTLYKRNKAWTNPAAITPEMVTKAWQIYRQVHYTQWLAGGLIYYPEARSNSCDAPQFSVSMSQERDARWEFHT